MSRQPMVRRLRALGFSICALSVVGLPVLGQELGGSPHKPGPGHVVQRVSLIEGLQEVPYLVFVPSTYDPEIGEWPLLMGLHGTAGDPTQILEIPGLLKLAEEYGVLVVCPATSGWYGSTFFLKKPLPLSVRSDLHVADVLRRTRDEFRIDASRIFLLGVSKGGAGAWHLALRYPDLWAGVAPISPAGYRGTSHLESISHVPVIMVQGEKDRAVSVAENRRVAAAMERLGMRYRYWEIPGAGHNLDEFDVAQEVFGFFARQSTLTIRDP